MKPLARAEESVLVVIDVQPTFLKAIHERERVVSRTRFLARAANALGIPILATEQYATRMGGTHEDVEADLEDAPRFDKLAFSAAGCPAFMDALASLGRMQAVLVGIETHICVNQTSHHLLQSGFEVLLAADAVSARTASMHEIGLGRIGAAGAAIAHSESIVYEWMLGGDHPKFREVLETVKAFPAG